jgi:hypothetical protein
MHIDTIYPTKYVKASDLQGCEMSVTIERAELEEVGEDRKLVLYFKGKQKGLVANKTNANRIAHYYGPNTEAWLGRDIVLYTDLISFQGKTTEAIRVKVRMPETPARPAAVRHSPEQRDGAKRESDPLGEDLDDEIPF